MDRFGQNDEHVVTLTQDDTAADLSQARGVWFADDVWDVDAALADEIARRDIPVRLPQSVVNVGDTPHTVHVAADAEGQAVGPVSRYARHVVFDEGVLHIPDNFLQGSWWASEVTMPQGLVSIGSAAFAQCPNLAKADIPSSVQAIGDGAFAGDRALVRMDLPASLQEVPPRLFEQCSALESVTIGPLVRTLGDSCLKGTAVRDLQLPQGLVAIGRQALADNRQLTQLRMPPTVQQLRSGCLGRTSVSHIDLGPCAMLSYLAPDATDKGTTVDLPSTSVEVEPQARSRIRTLATTSAPLLAALVASVGDQDILLAASNALDCAIGSGATKRILDNAHRCGDVDVATTILSNSDLVSNAASTALAQASAVGQVQRYGNNLRNSIDHLQAIVQAKTQGRTLTATLDRGVADRAQGGDEASVALLHQVAQADQMLAVVAQARATSSQIPVYDYLRRLRQWDMSILDAKDELGKAMEGQGQEADILQALGKMPAEQQRPLASAVRFVAAKAPSMLSQGTRLLDALPISIPITQVEAGELQSPPDGIALGDELRRQMLRMFGGPRCSAPQVIAPTSAVDVALDVPMQGIEQLRQRGISSSQAQVRLAVMYAGADDGMSVDVRGFPPSMSNNYVRGMMFNEVFGRNQQNVRLTPAEVDDIVAQDGELMSPQALRRNGMVAIALDKSNLLKHCTVFRDIDHVLSLKSSQVVGMLEQANLTGNADTAARIFVNTLDDLARRYKAEQIKNATTVTQSPDGLVRTVRLPAATMSGDSAFISNFVQAIGSMKVAGNRQWWEQEYQADAHQLTCNGTWVVNEEARVSSSEDYKKLRDELMQGSFRLKLGPLPTAALKDRASISVLRSDIVASLATKGVIDSKMVNALMTPQAKGGYPKGLTLRPTGEPGVVTIGIRSVPFMQMPTEDVLAKALSGPLKLQGMETANPTCVDLETVEAEEKRQRVADKQMMSDYSGTDETDIALAEDERTAENREKRQALEYPQYVPVLTPVESRSEKYVRYQLDGIPKELLDHKEMVKRQLLARMYWMHVINDVQRSALRAPGGEEGNGMVVMRPADSDHMVVVMPKDAGVDEQDIRLAFGMRQAVKFGPVPYQLLRDPDEEKQSSVEGNIFGLRRMVLQHLVREGALGAMDAKALGDYKDKQGALYRHFVIKAMDDGESAMLQVVPSPSLPTLDFKKAMDALSTRKIVLKEDIKEMHDDILPVVDVAPLDIGQVVQAMSAPTIGQEYPTSADLLGRLGDTSGRSALLQDLVAQCMDGSSGMDGKAVPKAPAKAPAKEKQTRGPRAKKEQLSKGNSRDMGS